MQHCRFVFLLNCAEKGVPVEVQEALEVQNLDFAGRRGRNLSRCVR